MPKSEKTIGDVAPRDENPIKAEQAVSQGRNPQYQFLDEDFFADDSVPSDVAENHDKYLYDDEADSEEKRFLHP